MFWRFGGYANVSAVDQILDKPDFTLEELLDEGDLIQELKAHSAKLIDYLRDDAVLERLLDFVTASKLEPVLSKDDANTTEAGPDTSMSSNSTVDQEDEEEKEKKRNRYAYVSAEILSSDTWSLSAALLENTALLSKFWQFLERPAPLDPLQASYFTKVNEALLDKKTEEMLEFLKSVDGVVKHMLQHVDSPMVMDLLLKIISLEKQIGGEGIVDWLHSQQLMPILLSFLSDDYSWATQTSAGDFLKAIITISANASQNEQSCIGPNELTRQLVSAPCVERLIGDMLRGGNPLTVGVGIVIEVIRKNNSDYDPEVGPDAGTTPSSRDPIYLGTLLRKFAAHVPDFMALILSPNHTVGGVDGPINIRRKSLPAAFGGKIEPLGFDRFKTCELMAELLHCSNMGLLNEIGSEEFIMTRDQERERLREEGNLNSQSSRKNSVDEDLTMKTTSSTHGRDSPDTSKRLEVQNVTDDDGFEQVNPATDFDERPDLDDYDLSANKPESLSFLDKDEEDFVDEPLASPKYHSFEDLSDRFPDPTMTVLPLSPTKELSQDVAGLGTNPTSSSESSDITSLKLLEDMADQLSSPHITDIQANSSRSDDMPAPLTINKSTTSITPATDPSKEHASPDNDNDHKITSAEDDDILRDDTDAMSITHHGEHEPMPVVGDYLKMQFVEHKVVPTIIDFFFRFPWNNFLHNVVYDVVQQVFNGPMDRGFNRTLAIDLFDTGDITTRIVDGQRKSDESQSKRKMRLGYMGHLTLIAEEVVKFTERHLPELLSESVVQKVMHNDWAEYVEVTLSETRERDNAILGGARPDVMASRGGISATGASSFGGQSSALADAGLNGGYSSESMEDSNGQEDNSNNFASAGVNNTLSGFGSSSDEEDEEMEEVDDETGARKAGSGAEFSRYITTPSTTTALTSSSEPTPPLEPPPPPPINTPSAARRRLAARLAAKNADANSSSTNNPSSLPPPPSNDYDNDFDGNVDNVNPFLTEEDDAFNSAEEGDDDDDAFGDFQHGGEHRRGSMNSNDDIDDLVERADKMSGFEDDFTVGDLEVAAEGKGIMPPGTDIVGGTEKVDTLFNSPHDDNEVNSSGSEDDQDFESSLSGTSKPAVDRTQSSLDSNMGLTRNGSGRRKIPTTEAKRRTSLEDDDEDEEAVALARRKEGDAEDDDLVEIRHEESVER